MENREQCPRPKISEILMNGKSLGKCQKLQRITNNLQWRQQYQNSSKYLLQLGNNPTIELSFNQIDNGEMRGIGTGAVVWPAAHVLVKYMEKRYGSTGLRGKRVIDIGSGTGFAGIAAAALGANVLLTDQLCVKDLILSNIEEYHSLGSMYGSASFAEYNWDESAASLNPPFDLVIVSDCVLPKLYPIEPLVKAIHAVMDGSSLALFSYEHRVYPFFDPRHEFQRIARQYQLSVNRVPLTEHDQYFCCDDIEIWEVKKETSTDFDDMVTWPVTDSRGGISLQNWGDSQPVIHAHCVVHCDIVTSRLLTIHQRGCRIENSLSDSESGGVIGTSLWASSVVVSRFLLKYPSYSSLSSLFRQDKENSYAPCGNKETIVYDIGAGCGLASLVLSLCGYSVIATDKSDILSLLKQNIDLNEPNDITLKSFDWKDFESKEIVSQVFSQPPDIILMSDCFYQNDSAYRLWKLLDMISTNKTLVVIANELRSSLDDFLQYLRTSTLRQSPNCRQWTIQEIELFDDDLEIFRGEGGYLAVRPVKIYLCIPID